MGAHGKDYSGEDHGDYLAAHGGYGRAGDPHCRKPEIAKDEQRVQGYVDKGPHQLEYHGPEHIARGLEYLLEHHHNEAAKGEDTADRYVLVAHQHYLRVGLEHLEKGRGKEGTVHGEDRRSAEP